MNYIVSEEELLKLQFYMYDEKKKARPFTAKEKKMFAKFLKAFQPVELVGKGVYNKTYHCLFLGMCKTKDIKPLFKKYHNKNIKIYISKIKE